MEGALMAAGLDPSARKLQRRKEVKGFIKVCHSLAEEGRGWHSGLHLGAACAAASCSGQGCHPALAAWHLTQCGPALASLQRGIGSATAVAAAIAKEQKVVRERKDREAQLRIRWGYCHARYGAVAAAPPSRGALA